MHIRKRIRPIWLGLVLLLVVGCSLSPSEVTQNPTTPPNPTAPAPTAVAAATTIPTEPTAAPSPTTAVATLPPAEKSTPTVVAEEPPSTATSAAETPEPATTEPATPNGDLATIETLDNLILKRRDMVMLAQEFGRTTSDERVARTEPLTDQVGDSVTFWMSNISDDTYYTTTATLHMALDHVLMYVEDGIEFDRAALETSARDFNDRIYPRTRELFGEEWSPGVDGDPRITVLNARIAGAGGYFSGSNQVPRSVNRYSNEREMFFMNIDDRPLGTATYSSVLAHEFQHMIEWHQSQRPATWINEGLSQLAEELNGYSGGDMAGFYLADPDIQLTDWGEEPASSLAHYSASYLFLSYFYDRYRDHIDLKELVREGAGHRLGLLAADAAEGQPTVQTFDQLYADWAVANLLNDPGLEQGRWSYKELPDTVQPELDDDGNVSGEVKQFGADYIELPSVTEGTTLQFDGDDYIGVVATEPEDEVSWWSNRGDDAESTLTGSFDLSGVQSATLQFNTWFDIEKDYDYVFASVSTDGGTTWQTLPGQHTTTEDPQGANYGNGYTSTSGGETATWVEESIDLTPFAGKPIMLRFSLISDDAFNKPGLLLDNIRIPEIGYSDDVEQGAGVWEANGWVRTNNQLDQRWQVRLVHFGGGDPEIIPISLDEQNQATIDVPEGGRSVLIVMATTPHTTEAAAYEISSQ